MKRSLYQSLANRNVHVTISLKTKLLLRKLQAWTLASNTAKRKTLRRAAGNRGLFRSKPGFIYFLQQILWINFCFSAEVIIFVGLCCYRKVLVLYDVQFDKRNLTVQHSKLNRLFQFTRAVSFPAPAGLPQFAAGAGKELHRPCNRRCSSGNVAYFPL